MSTPLTPPNLAVPTVDVPDADADEEGTCEIAGCPGEPIVETGYRLCDTHAFDDGLP